MVCLHLPRNEQSANDQQTTTRLLSSSANRHERVKARDSRVGSRIDDTGAMSARPGNGFPHSFGGIHDHPLVCRNVDLSGPHIFVTALYGQLIGAGRDDQFLFPPPVVIELITVTDEQVRSLPVQQHGIPVCSLDRYGAKGTRNFAGDRFQTHAEFCCFSRLDCDRAGNWLVSIVDQFNFVLTCAKGQGVMLLASLMALSSTKI